MFLFFFYWISLHFQAKVFRKQKLDLEFHLNFFWKLFLSLFFEWIYFLYLLTIRV